MSDGLPPAPIKSVQTCKRCHHAMRPESQELAFVRGSLRIVVEDVPMSVCPNCGERYVPGPIAVELSKAIDRLVKNIEATTEDSGVVTAEELRAHRKIKRGEPAFA